ncbi:MAG: NTP transferase domain-containing protein [Myxococcales bacterium]|nr:NTP transferase domain-containing protein [Myxococcales bacterium]
MRDALIPAAGAGARLDRPGTPKPLVAVGGEPLLHRLLRQLAAAGVERAVVLVGHAADRVAAALPSAVPPHLRVDVRFAADWTRGLAHSLRAANELFDAPFLLAMADHVFDDALVARVAAQRPDGDVVALVDPVPDRVFDVADAVKVVRRGPHGLRFARHLPAFDAIDAGLFACDPAVLFPALQAGADLAHALDHLARARRVRLIDTDALGWDDVDTPAGLVHAELRLRRTHREAVQRPATPAGLAPTHRFVTGAPTTTDIVVARGAAADPVEAGVVPPENAGSPVVLFTDARVDALHGRRFVARLRAAGHVVHPVVLPEGEAAKTLPMFAEVAERVLAAGVDERSTVISLGGGAVCNVAGMAAATLYRGLDLVHVPSTLMAQCDAAISHKQAVNGRRGKNLVGAYYAPRRIVVDVDLLATLETRWLIDGMAEVLKHGLAQDAGYAAWLSAVDPDVRDPALLEAVVRRNIELKCALMADDPKEHREALVLQYGHPIGHAIEHLSGYRLGHGEAVAVGMAVTARVARLLGGCDDATVAAHDALIARFGLPTTVPDDVATRDVLAALRYDKKRLADGARMPLVADVGRLWQVADTFAIPVDDSVVAEAVALCRAPAAARRTA